MLSACEALSKLETVHWLGMICTVPSIVLLAMKPPSPDYSCRIGSAAPEGRQILAPGVSPGSGRLTHGEAPEGRQKTLLAG